MNKIECEQIVNTCGISIELRKLTCKICYCLLINPKMCHNNKCEQVFCADCIKTSLKNEPVCPFCRINDDKMDFSAIGIDPNVIFVLNNLRLLCFHLSCGNKFFRMDNYPIHVNEMKGEYSKCMNEQCESNKILTANNGNNNRNIFSEVTVRVKLCDLCKKIYCRECNCLKLCSKCGKSVCDMCRGEGRIKCHEELKVGHKRITTPSMISISISNQISTSPPTLPSKVSCEMMPISTLHALNSASVPPGSSIPFVLPKTSSPPSNSTPQCMKCQKIIADTANPFASGLCHICLSVNCSDCSFLCHICKMLGCVSCLIKCDNCDCSHVNSYACTNCFENSNTKHGSQLDLFKRCTYETEQCSSKYCLNCVKTCNACSLFLCSKHILKCEGCEEYVCDKHYKTCEICEPESNEISFDNNNIKISTSKIQKCCLKKCRLKCESCLIKSTNFCNRKIHPLVSYMLCGHCICSSCLKRCDTCHKENCPLCPSNDLIHCTFCKKESCKLCLRYCYRCSNYYCDQHKCGNCHEKLNRCIPCLLNESRMICPLCSEEIDICEKCNDLLFCSVYCFVEFSGKVDHLCQMFFCHECLELKKCRGEIKKRKYSSEEESENSVSEKSKSCEYFDSSSLMDIQHSHLSNQTGSSRLTLNALRTRREREDKVKADCEESCVCEIF